MSKPRPPTDPCNTVLLMLTGVDFARGNQRLDWCCQIRLSIGAAHVASELLGLIQSNIRSLQQTVEIVYAMAKANTPNAYGDMDQGVLECHELIVDIFANALGNFESSRDIGSRAQLSPHTGCANNPLNAFACEMVFANAVMSGVSRCSGMLGINS
jgi:hypothetical protein